MTKSPEESEQALLLLRKLSKHKQTTIMFFTDFWRETFDVRRVLPVSAPPTSPENGGGIGPIVIIRVSDAILDLKTRYGFFTQTEAVDALLPSAFDTNIIS